jgi:hypothetical protein
MNRTLPWLIGVVVVLVGLLLYRYRSGHDLEVDPHVREEIEKAKRR